MKKSLFAKFILGYVIFGIVGFVFISTFSSRMIYRYLVDQNSKKLYDEAMLMAYTYEDDETFKTDISSGIGKQLGMVGHFLNASIWLVDNDGTVILDSDSGLHNRMKIDAFDPRVGEQNYSIGRYSGMFSEDVMSVNAPIHSNYRTIGYVVIHLPMSAVLQSTNQILNIVYLTSAVMFILSFVILILFSIFVYRPISKVTEAAVRYARGDLDYKLDIRSRDEMGYLADTMNYMAGELAGMEKYQKEFVANISHDFRSPLTSIKGYSEAMLDGTIPPDKYKKYLERIISEADRLNKLTYSMITLNSSDARNMISRTAFDINRMIRDVCAANENACDAKRIGFQLVFEDAQETVYADFGKIQQVLYNLIDNAIKFSYEGKSILITTKRRQKKVFVSVRDSGIGIPKDSIKKIWDRFYKTDASRGRDKTGTGLGLSIVKEIIQAHGETIDVVSTEKVGTEFSFSLTAADAVPELTEVLQQRTDG